MMNAAIRRPLLKVEAAWWMTRIYLSNINVWPGIMGWLAADRHPPVAGPVELCLFALLAGGALFIVNDIFDAEGDKVTAPYLPLPSGLLNPSQSWVAAGIYLGAGIVALGLSSRTVVHFALAVGITVVASVGSGLYSKVKNDGLFASIVISIPQSLTAVIAWVLAGGGRVWWLLAIVAYCLCACVSNNILAALRDVDLDPVVGNKTFPVRVGGPKAFKVAAGIAMLAVVPVVVLGIAVGGGWPALIIGAAAVTVMGTCYRRTLASFEKPNRGRTGRMKDMKRFKQGEYVRHVAVAAAFSLPWALAAGAVLQASLLIGHRIYTHRLIKGGIARSLGRLDVAAEVNTGAETA